MTSHEEAFRAFHADRPLAHRMLFAHRRHQASPDFHDTIIRAWHGPKKHELFKLFRGAAKSTLSEEALAIQAGFREFKNCLIVGSSETRAAERLHSIKREMEKNEDFIEVFGYLRGAVWGDSEVVLSTGAKIQARGRGQSLRGIKHEDMRPDLLLCDDLEDSFDDVSTPEKRRRIMLWFMSDLMPALDPSYRARMNATPLDPESLPEELGKDPEWKPVHHYPVYYLGENGEKVSSWPERFPLRKGREHRGKDVIEIEKLEASYRRKGLIREFNAEYLCKAEAMEDKPFRGEYLKLEPRARTWEAVFAMFDPARTVGAESATTGWAVWSWVADRLIVWEADGQKLLPDEIIRRCFDIGERYDPVYIGVEEDGLNQWLMQPIRQEQVRRGVTLPFRAMKAPRSKNDFIRGLQPFFKAGEISFAQQLPVLRAQLISFPTGKIDVPNALAYALMMRPGTPIYPDFGRRHVSPDLAPTLTRPAYLALNSTGALTTGVLAQMVDGTIRVLADFVREGEPAEVIRSIMAEAQLTAGKAVKPVAGPLHFDKHLNVGLRQAVTKLPAELMRGSAPIAGRTLLMKELGRDNRGLPAVRISADARWTLNALAAGYCRAVVKGGSLSEEPEEGPYKVLMQGFESWLGLMANAHSTEEEEGGRNYAITPGGRPYLSAMPRR